MYNEMKIEALVLSSLVFLLLAKTANAVRGCTVIAIQPDLLWKKAVCDSDTSLLTKIPSDLPKTLISLRITQQSIRRLGDGELRKLVYLEELYLDSCELEQVEANVFEGLNRLRILSLRNNSIHLDENGILPVTFYHLPTLEILDLSENPLGQIPPNLFPSSLGKSLLELRISYTKGESPLKLEAAAFAGLLNLQVLDMSFCRLETLSSEFRSIFHRMEKLRELQLGGNPWHCDCNLRWLREWYLSDTLPSMILSYEKKTKFGTTDIVTPTCKSPYVVKRRQIFIPSGRNAIEPAEFVCKQWINSNEKHVVVALGSTLSLTCQGYFEIMKTVQWFKDNVPLVIPSPNYFVSQSNSLDFVANLTIKNVRHEDKGIWECGLDNGSVTQKASINVTVKLPNSVVPGDVQRQNLVYAGIGVAIVFILLAVVALAVFFCWGKRGTDKPQVFTSCRNRFQKNSVYGVGIGEDARELIGTRAANSHPDSPVPLKNSTQGHSNLNSTSIFTSKPVPMNNTLSCDKIPSVESDISSPKLVSLTTATTTTAVLTQPSPATGLKQPTSVHSAVLLATDFSSPSNTSITANGADLYHLPPSGSYGGVSLPNRLLAQITGSTNSSTIPSSNNPILISAPCPIHGVNAKFSNHPKEQPQLSKPVLRKSVFGACPIHGSPSSIASRNNGKKMASSFTQTPRHTTKSKSSTSLRVSRHQSDRSSYHSRNTSVGRRESLGSHHSSSSTQCRYRTLPSRISAKTFTTCPIHGQFAPSILLKRRSSSMCFNQYNQSASENRKTQSITMDVPYCSSCESSSEVTAPARLEFEEYSSAFSDSPVAEFSDYGSSDSMVNMKTNSQHGSMTLPVNRGRYKSMQNYRDSSSSSSGAEEVVDVVPSSLFSKDLTDRSSLSLIPHKNNTHLHNQVPSNTRTILGEPLVLTSMDCAGANNAVLSRSLQRSREGLCKHPRKNNSNHSHHSIERKAVPSPSSSNQIAPKSILVKNSSHRKTRRRSSDFDDGSTNPL
nr:leucine rich repeat immunoglobulin domain,leucine rich repeat and fibronectin type III [Hymenolepis microstoma]